MYQHHRVIEIALSCFDPAQKLTALLNYVNQLSTQTLNKRQRNQSTFPRP